MASGPRQPYAREGLYDSSHEHDACGVGFIADLSGSRRHDTVARALTVLQNLEHRGAQGADPETGDGAGITTQMPDEFLRAVAGFDLPPAGSYAAGLAFLDPEADQDAVRHAVGQLAAAEGLTVLGWLASAVMAGAAIGMFATWGS